MKKYEYLSCQNWLYRIDHATSWTPDSWNSSHLTSKCIQLIEPGSLRCCFSSPTSFKHSSFCAYQVTEQEGDLDQTQFDFEIYIMSPGSLEDSENKKLGTLLVQFNRQLYVVDHSQIQRMTKSTVSLDSEAVATQPKFIAMEFKNVTLRFYFRSGNQDHEAGVKLNHVVDQMAKSLKPGHWTLDPLLLTRAKSDPVGLSQSCTIENLQQWILRHYPQDHVVFLDTLDAKCSGHERSQLVDTLSSVELASLLIELASQCSSPVLQATLVASLDYRDEDLLHFTDIASDPTKDVRDSAYQQKMSHWEGYFDQLARLSAAGPGPASSGDSRPSSLSSSSTISRRTFLEHQKQHIERAVHHYKSSGISQFQKELSVLNIRKQIQQLKQQQQVVAAQLFPSTLRRRKRKDKNTMRILKLMRSTRTHLQEYVTDLLTLPASTMLTFSTPPTRTGSLLK